MVDALCIPFLILHLGAADSLDDERGESQKNSIPLHLQKLFARLQLSDKQYVSTKSLTKSFGWTDADAWTQHDAQVVTVQFLLVT